MEKTFVKKVPAPPDAVTFIIGNGFDLGMGMKTRYSDMYEEYVNTHSQSNVIQSFKSNLAKGNPFEKWADFEMGMADYAQKLSSEAELIECVRDFKSHMVKHLDAENQRMVNLIRNPHNASNLVRELGRSLYEFHAGFIPNVSSMLKQLLGEPPFRTNIITFNYTNILEEMFTAVGANIVIPEKPLHIHGTLGRDVVLGVDNIEQLSGCKYCISQKGKRAFVKTLFNEQYDSSRVSAAKKMISESSVICTYGFSMGKSDRTWVNLLIEWLKSDSSHRLVVFQHDTVVYNYYNSDELMDVEDEKKELLMARMGIEEKSLQDQIHIPVGCDIFNFEFKTIISPSKPIASFNVFEATK